MNRGLIRKGLAELLGPTLIFGGAVFLIEAVLAFVLPRFQQQFAAQWLQMQFAQTIIKALVGTDVAGGAGPEVFGSIPWVHPVALATVWGHAAVCCTRTPAGEVDRGTIDVLLGLPVSRWGLYISDSVAWIVTGLSVVGLALLGNLLGRALSLQEFRIETARIVLAAINLAGVYLAVGGVSWLVSAASDRRGRAISIVFIVVIGSFFLNYLAQLWSPAKSVVFLSVLNYHRPFEVMRTGTFPVRDVAVLIAAAVVFWTAGGVVMSRRDLTTL